MQPAPPLGAGQRQHAAVGAVDDDGIGGGGTLFTERIAVMPDGTGIGSGIGGGHG